MRLRLTASLLLLPTLLAAQQDRGHAPAAKLTGGGVFPAGWTARADQGTDLSGFKLETMAPGWHVTTASSGILYREQDRASGSYTLSAKLHLFPEAAGHREAYGIFFGGADLQGAGQRYVYFLLRGDGTFKVKRRAGASATDASGDWKAHPAIVKGKPDGSVSNALAVVVGKDRVIFQVNGQEVYSAPAAGIETDGVFGLRINHNLSVHVETLAVSN